MDLFVYSDESGVFDKAHNEIFVFGGLIFIGKDQKDEYARRYIAAEPAQNGSPAPSGLILRGGGIIAIPL